MNKNDLKLLLKGIAAITLLSCIVLIFCPQYFQWMAAIVNSVFFLATLREAWLTHKERQKLWR